MLIYLDSVIVIYHLEQTAGFGSRATSRLATLSAAGDAIAVSDLVRMECRIGPLRAGDAARLRLFDGFFTRPDVLLVPFTPAVFDRAAEIRARHRFPTPDALHLAAAEVSGCDRLLTNDERLNAFAGRTAVEVLP